MRDSFIFYRSFYEALEDLDDDQKLACYEALFGYAFDGTEPSEKGVVSTVFKLAKPLIDRNNRNYENGQKGGRPKTEPEPTDNPTVTEPEPTDNPNKDKDKDIYKELKEKEEEKEKPASRRAVFVKPTPEEVAEYCRERGGRVDPQAFMDFYESKGWKVGNQPMKDWRAAVRNWERRDKPKARQPSFHDQRQYDYTGLEKRLLAKGR